MSTSISSDQVGEGRALALVPGPPQPWYMTPPPPPLDRGALEDEHTRILAHAFGDHLPYELVLRAAAVAEQLQRCA
jgi:hypothetical protein